MSLLGNIGAALGSNILHTVTDTVDEYFYTEEEKADTLSKKTKLIMDMYNAEADRDVKIKEINASDRDSARKLQSSALVNGRGIERVFVYILASLLIAGSFYFMNIVFTQEIQNEKIAMYTLGTINTLLMSVVYYFFGSSMGSNAKTDILHSITANKRGV